MIRKYLMAILILISYASVCTAEGLDVLIEVAKSQALIKKQYEEETRRFNGVKKGIESGAIQKGQSRQSIIGKYGEPIVSIKDIDGKREDCIYKPETSSFFKGIRATLIFTPEGILDEARIEEK